MPVTISGQGLNQIVNNLHRLADDPELALQLGKALSECLVDAFQSTNSSVSGATVRALSKVSPPEKTGSGWKISVGDGDAVGLESQSAPRGTLRAFYKFVEGGPERSRGATGTIKKYSNWQGMSSANKRLLEQGRRAGMFGGRGPNYANYMWIQNTGNLKAGITGRGFIAKGTTQWRADVPRIVERYIESVRNQSSMAWVEKE